MGIIASLMRAPGAQIWLPTGEVDPIEVTMELFKWRQFEPEVILLAVGWYLRFSRRAIEQLLMLLTIETTPSHVAGFLGYFAVLSLVILPAAVAFARRKTSRWFLLCAGSSLLIGGALNWWGLLPIFSWNG
jgi:hypothetical protein